MGSPTRPAFIDPRPATQGDVRYLVKAVDSWGSESAVSAPAPIGTGAVATKPVELSAEAEAAKLQGGAHLLEDAGASGGRGIAFGPPDKVPEYAGEAELSVDLEPGHYHVWLRVKGSPIKSAGFFWVRLGETEHYSRMFFSGWTAKPEWVWRRATFLKSVRDPQERPMAYEVETRPAVLRIRHRANYTAIDRVFITTHHDSVPEPGAGDWHPGCSAQFRRASPKP